MPKFKGKLFDHQVEGVQFALSTPYHINGFEMGLGKTITALKVACLLNVKTLVICPAFLRRNWEAEIAKFTEGLDIEIMSYSQVTKRGIFVKDDCGDWEFKSLVEGLAPYKFIIGDEIHMAKNPKAKRTIVFHEMIKALKPHKVMMMSGTPIKNRVSEFWSLLQVCFYGDCFPEFSPYHRLYYKFCHKFSYERSFEINGFNVVKFEGVKHAPQLRDLISKVYIRRRAEEVLDLPDATDIPIYIKGNKKFDSGLKEAYELFKVNPQDPAYMSLKAANALAKIPDTIKLAQDMLDQDEKVIIFSCHREAVRRIAAHFKVKYIDGTVDGDKRHQIIEDFNNSEEGILVLTIGAASVGYNITSANKMIINDFPFVPADLEQAKKRMHRIGQKLKCFYYLMFISEFDQDLYDMINRKSSDIRKVYE